jgi:3',5'-cyclic AMP phosphodiesterase CpdA
MPSAVRLAHLSDIHVTSLRCRWRFADWTSKRLTTWLNLRVLGRGDHFREADRIVERLRREFEERAIDRVIFSGDATAMGFEEEVARAVELLGVSQPGGRPGLAVPGNHDYCTHLAARGGVFERLLSPWQAGERLTDDVYPFAQQAGHVWLIAVNSSTPNRLPIDARGRVGAEQLGRLEALLRRLPPGPRLLVTHYPVCGPDGRPQKRFHGLRDVRQIVKVSHVGGVSLWLHGHQHVHYRVHGPHAPFPVICAGSATQKGHWSYLEYEISDTRLQAVRRAFVLEDGGFRDVDRFELELSVSG